MKHKKRKEKTNINSENECNLLFNNNICKYILLVLILVQYFLVLICLLLLVV